MKRLTGFIFAGLLAIGGLPAGAGPTQGGITSEGVEYAGYIPFEIGTATGASIIGKYMYVTGWKAFSIYDVSDPLNPVRLTTEPFGFKFENENVASNGKILLFSEEVPRNILHVWDVEDKTNPTEIATLSGAGGHTATCILRCKYSLSSEGPIVDLRDPSKPEIIGNWKTELGLGDGVHDLEEFKNGYVITSPYASAFQVVDVRNPLKPKVVAQGEHPNPSGFIFHSGRWPNEGRDRFVMMQGEQNAQPQCDDNTGPFMTFDASKWKKTKTLTLVDTFRVDNGTVTDGSPPANGLGCSAHWFQEHETFRNGGLVAIGYYEHGTRFLRIDSAGQIRETGWFLPYAGSTSAAYWLTKNIVYSVDYTRGVDILRYGSN